MPGGVTRAMARLLLVHVGVQVDVGGGELLVPEPERDDGDVGAGVEEAHGGGVPEGVHGDVLAAQRSGS